MDQVCRITRQELYEKVWATPMQKLALEFKISDVGLAKICKRHHIPVPGRGYWARLAAGQKPTRIALPRSTDADLEDISIIPHDKQPSLETPPLATENIPKIEISEDRRITHRHVLRMEKSVLKNKKDERGFLMPAKGRALPISVSLEALPRVLRTLDALFIVLDEAGHKIEWSSPYNAPVHIIASGEKIRISVAEAVRRTEHKPTRDELAAHKADYWWRTPKWDYAPTGCLKFTLESVEVSHLRHSWADGKRQQIESCVGEMFMRFGDVANAVKKYREDCAEAARQRAVEQKRAEERRRQQEEYNRKAEFVTKVAQAWRESRQLHELAFALKQAARSPAIPMEHKLGIWRVADWTERHANFLDPLADVFQNTELVSGNDRHPPQ